MPNFTIVDAIHSLRPGATWSIEEDYASLNWLDETQIKPTEAELITEAARMNQEATDTAYKALRAAEYPPITDYIDGVVKGDQTQIDAYIATCQAVKSKYPKPN